MALSALCRTLLPVSGGHRVWLYGSAPAPTYPQSAHTLTTVSTPPQHTHTRTLSPVLLTPHNITHCQSIYYSSEHISMIGTEISNRGFPTLAHSAVAALPSLTGVHAAMVWSSVCVCVVCVCVDWAALAIV